MSLQVYLDTGTRNSVPYPPPPPIRFGSFFAWRSSTLTVPLKTKEDDPWYFGFHGIIILIFRMFIITQCLLFSQPLFRRSINTLILGIDLSINLSI